jgi:hypothetical protein
MQVNNRVNFRESPLPLFIEIWLKPVHLQRNRISQIEQILQVLAESNVWAAG